MSKKEEEEQIRVNPGYVLGQLSRAFVTSQEHEDTKVRVRASKRIADWIQVFEGMLSGALKIGSRTPLPSTPAWATLKVLKGGFASGELLAGGELQDHERERLSQLPSRYRAAERAALNSHYLTDDGLSELRQMLASGCYRVNLPEEGALMVVAWLIAHGRAAEARVVLDEIGPFMGRLRFYPAPHEKALAVCSDVYLQDVGRTVQDLRSIKPGLQSQRLREAIQIWTPLYDRAASLFVETMKDGWPCQQYPEGWRERATELLNEYRRQREEHRGCGKPERTGENFQILRTGLDKCIEKPAELTGREVGTVRKVLRDIEKKRGLPGSERCQRVREAQTEQARRATSYEIAQVLIGRLEKLPQEEPLAADSDVLVPIFPDEAEHFRLDAGLAIPETVGARLLRSMAAPVQVLVDRHLITSADTLARVIPQLSSQAYAGSIEDADLRRLYGEIYKAFRRRRSLLLLNLESQVRFNELPWIRALSQVCDARRGSEQARQTLVEIVVLAITGFPERILPNKLLQELRSLADAAGLSLPIVDELAADIFMGDFSEKFLQAAQKAAELLEGTLYERYYGIPYGRIRKIDDARPTRYGPRTSEKFARLCGEMAGTSEGGPRSVARNGQIIEQEQIITTHNLAVLFAAFGLRSVLGERMEELPGRCFQWICHRQRHKTDSWRARLRIIKNSAYAWRQMVFFLSVMPPESVEKFLSWADKHLHKQPSEFQVRFSPAVDGLASADRKSPGREQIEHGQSSSCRFLGWTTGRHWLLPAAELEVSPSAPGPGSESKKPWWQVW